MELALNIVRLGINSSYFPSIDYTDCECSFVGQKADRSLCKPFVSFSFLINITDLKICGNEIGLLIRVVFSYKVLISFFFPNEVSAVSLTLRLFYFFARLSIFEILAQKCGINTFSL